MLETIKLIHNGRYITLNLVVFINRRDILMKLDQKLSFSIKIGDCVNGHMVAMATKSKNVMLIFKS